MTSRHRTRTVAFQILYQDDLNPRSNPILGEQFLARRLHEAEAIEFARALIRGVRQNRAELDAAIGRTASHWSVHRMAATDRNVLRLAVYELVHTDTPGKVVIDQAIELAKRFGTAHSGAFVNRVLDHILQEKKGIAAQDVREKGSIAD